MQSGSQGSVAYAGWKIQGSGAVSLAENHPEGGGGVIVYACPDGGLESDEAATCTRGTAHLLTLSNALVANLYRRCAAAVSAKRVRVSTARPRRPEL
jgi:hypothetical protein